MSLLVSKNNQSCLKMCSRSGGFSLSELALVFVIMGLMIVPLYLIIFQVTKLKPNEARFDIIQEALAEHLRVTGTLPCPADPAVDVDTGAAAFASVAGCAGGSVVNVSGVSIGAVPIDNLRAALSCGDTGLLTGATGDILGALKEGVYGIREVLTGEKGVNDGDGNLIGTRRSEDVRCVQREYLLDDTGSKFVYAVTTAATVAGFDLFDNTVGQIRITDALGNQATINDQLYVVLSVGGDKKGAYQRDGTLGIPCGFDPGVDIENCDYTVAGGEDNIFVAAPRNDQTGATFYDDRVDFGIAGFFNEDTFWQWGGAGGTGRDMMLGGNARLIVDMATPDAADTVANFASAPLAPDAIVVNSGGVQVDDDLVVNGTASLRTIGEVVVGTSSRASGDVTAPAFCYKDSLTAGAAFSNCPP